MTYPGHRFAAIFFAVVVAAWLVAMLALLRASALSPDASGAMLVVFEPGTPREVAFAAITKAGGNPVRESAFGFVWVVQSDEAGLAGRLADQGAIGSYRDLPINPNIAGCIALADAKLADALNLR